VITITILGIDPYLLRQISANCTDKLADIYECKVDDIDFFAPEGLLVHNGVEQNTWNLLIRVHAPLKVKVMEDQAVKILHQFIKEACVNMSIEFYYYSQDSRYEFLSDDHPRFMTEENTIVEDKEEFEQEEGEEPYLGDIFSEFNGEVEKEEKKKK
jgi:hypothetical protein